MLYHDRSTAKNIGSFFVVLFKKFSAYIKSKHRQKTIEIGKEKLSQ
jgi:hypothetical protein